VSAATERPARSAAALAGTVLLAVLLGLVSLAGVLAGPGWVPGAVLAVLAVVAATGTARALGLPSLLAPVFGAGALALVLTVLFLREPSLLGVVPTPGSLALAETLWAEAGAAVAAHPAPYPPGRGLEFVAALGAGLVALFVETVLVGLRLPAVSALGVLAVLVVPALVLPGSVGAAGAAAAALAALLLLAGGRRWGAAREPRTTPAPGSWARAAVVGAGVLAVALVLPAVVPGFVNGAFPQGSGLASDRAAGVGPLRGIGQDLRSPEQLPRLEYTTASGEPELLRVLTLEDFSGEEWFPTATDLDPHLAELGGTALTPVGSGPEETTGVRLRDWSGRWLPLPWAAVGIDGLEGGGWAWNPRDLTVRGDRVPPAGTGYEVRSVAPRPTADALRAAPAAPDTPELAPFRALPDGTPAALREAARAQAGDEGSAFDQALALQEWLRSEEFRYDVDLPLAEGYDAGGMASLEEFLERRTGYSGHFAPAMAVMARELGIPARVAVGYLPPSDPGSAFPGTAEDGPSVEVLPRDAHAWPELWFEGVGWVRFEPTPGTADVPGYAAGSPAESSEEGAEASAQPTGGASDPAPADTAQPDPSATAPQRAPEQGAGTHEEGVPGWLPWLAAAVAAALLALLLAVPRTVRERRRAGRARLLGDGTAPGPDRALAAWAEVEDLATDHGLSRDAAETPRVFVDRLAAAAPAAAEPLGRIGRDVERALYAPPGERWAPGAAPSDLAAVRDGLAAAGGATARRARWFPRSVTGR
jgi:transglutaminase-like putative cysteine protease